ncbi:MAG: Dabb family protein [Planctomycetes bacterium]|nr:Dabb family protein [Planctomycetota bacterium]
MVLHMVLLRVKKSVTTPRLTKLMKSIGGMKKFVPGIVGYEWGPYSSPEGLNKGFTHGFCMMFRNAKSRDTYLVHPEHEKVKAEVLKVLDGGLDAVVAFDFEA